MLRPKLIAASLLAAVMLVGCQMAAPGGAPITGDEISVTALPPIANDGAPDTSVAGTPHPKPRPEVQADPVTADPVTSEPEAEPEVAKPPEQLICEKAGGQWAVAGITGAYICIKPSRDGGKMCRKKGDCQGLCLARSGTCAPYAPLFGCNEVLEKDGRRVTLCID